MGPTCKNIVFPVIGLGNMKLQGLVVMLLITDILFIALGENGEEEATTNSHHEIPLYKYDSPGPGGRKLLFKSRDFGHIITATSFTLIDASSLYEFVNLAIKIYNE